MFFQEDARVFTALANALTAEADPCPTLFKYVVLNSQIEQIALGGNAFSVKNIEFRFAERRRDLVFHHFAARPRTDYAVALFDRLDAANIQSHRRVEFQSAA